VEAGLRNIERLSRAGEIQQVTIEADHLAFVARLLGRFLLYSVHGSGFDEAEHRVYWERVRPAYIAQADPPSLEEMTIPWEFLAFSLKYDYPR
jgi:hypothetical protein